MTRLILICAAITAALGVLLVYITLPAADGTTPLSGRSNAPLASPASTLADSGHPRIDGIACEPMEVTAYHVHAHLDVVASGKPVIVPAGIGIPSTALGPQCFYWLHTHDTSGLLHVEAPRGHYTLGQFFDVWGKPLTRREVAEHGGEVTIFVDGARYRGDPRGIELLSHRSIVLEVGRPLLFPKPFDFGSRP